MNREYTRADFEQVADALYTAFPDAPYDNKASSGGGAVQALTDPSGDDGLTLATDVICGFPGETDADFDETLDMAKK